MISYHDFVIIYIGVEIDSGLLERGEWIGKLRL